MFPKDTLNVLKYVLLALSKFMTFQCGGLPHWKINFLAQYTVLLMRLFTRDKPKIKVETTKNDGFSGWLKCTHCQEMLHANELKENLNCCRKCGYHYRLSAQERVDLLADPDTFTLLFESLRSLDPLVFVDSESYPERIAKAQAKSGHTEGVLTGTCSLDGHSIAFGVMDFQFMAGSMGSVVGERLTCLIEHAIKEKLPLVIVAASGGARMQESTLSLMQMAKTSAALAKLEEAGLPFLSVLTNPTTGGVTASFASLGDIILAEPGALICFAGPRVVEQVIRQKLPPGAQKSEFLLEHGMIDGIIHRHEMKGKLSQLLDYLTGNTREYLTLHAAHK
ncbi:MAG: Acetyl-coenzyme A carboxylase carboxyl transferase subunit beta [Chlamydiae bacterium]|nr:Acetyl-coenzyme A carboxylase carboxyl transferase subunit beta [Chlamydiota bacterium]